MAARKKINEIRGALKGFQEKVAFDGDFLEQRLLELEELIEQQKDRVLRSRSAIEVMSDEVVDSNPYR